MSDTGKNGNCVAVALTPAMFTCAIVSSIDYRRRVDIVVANGADDLTTAVDIDGRRYLPSL